MFVIKFTQGQDNEKNDINPIFGTDKFWYGNGLTYFEFNLNGADDAINSIYSTCGYKTEEEKKEEVKKEKKNSQITLTAKKLENQKKECLEKGGNQSWDFQKDIFKCEYTKTSNKQENNQINLTTKTIEEQKEECKSKGGNQSWDFQKDIFKCIK